MWLDVTGSGKNIVLEKSLEFAVRIVKFYKIGLKKERTFEPIYKQLLKSATSDLAFNSITLLKSQMAFLLIKILQSNLVLFSKTN